MMGKGTTGEWTTVGGAFFPPRRGRNRRNQTEKRINATTTIILSKTYKDDITENRWRVLFSFWISYFQLNFSNDKIHGNELGGKTTTKEFIAVESGRRSLNSRFVALFGFSMHHFNRYFLQRKLVALRKNSKFLRHVFSRHAICLGLPEDVCWSTTSL